MATVVEVDQNFYTQPDVRTAIDVLLTQQSRAIGQTSARFGDVRVDDVVVGYKMLEFHNHQNLGYEALHEHLRLSLDTEATWVVVPEPVLAELGSAREDALAGMVHALGASARLATMAERTDLCGSSFHFTDEETGHSATALVLYDSYPQGLGFAATAYDELDAILVQAIDLVAGCRCESGCPACVGSWTRDPTLTSWALRRLREYLPSPSSSVCSAPTPIAPARSRIPWTDVEVRWSEVSESLVAQRVQGAELLARSVPVRRGERLVITVASAGLAAWLTADVAQRQLWQAIAFAVDVPPTAALAIEVTQSDRAHRVAGALRRRHDDLIAGRSTSEANANHRLASGYILADGGPLPKEPLP